MDRRTLVIAAMVTFARAVFGHAVERAAPDASDLPKEKDLIKEEPIRVLFITEKNGAASEKELKRLQAKGGTFETLKGQGWKIGTTPDMHIQLVDKDAIPELIKRLNVSEFPTVACVSEGEILRSFKDGCSTPLDVWTFGWLLNGKSDRPNEPIPEPIRVAWTGNYRLRGNHWSVDGDWNPSKGTVVAHLRGGNHYYRLASYGAIEGWSIEELKSLHDDIHESEPSSGVASTGQSSGGSASGFGGGNSIQKQRDPFGAGHKFYR